MKSAFGRAVLICLLTLTAVALLPASAFAEVTREATFCGYNDGECDGTSNYGFQNQLSVLAEHSIDEVGEFVWFGDQLGSYGRIWSRTPLDDEPVLTTSISGLDEDPAGEFGPSIGGLAYDPELHVLFFSDTDYNRILAFHRAAPGDGYQVDYATVAQSPEPLDGEPAAPGGGEGEFGSLNAVGPKGMAWSTFNDRLYVVDYANLRIQIFSYEWGDGDANPGKLFYEGEISGDWEFEVNMPIDVAVDQSNGHVFVTDDGSDDTVREYDPDGNWVEDIGDGDDDSNTRPRHVAVDTPNRLLYVAKDGHIDVYSLYTDNLLGTYEDENFRNSESSIRDIDLDPVSRSLYVVMGTTSMDAVDTPTAAVYSLSPAPTCTVAPPITVSAGQSVKIPTNCTDPEGAVIQEFHRDSPPATGSITPNASRTELTFNAGTTTATVQARYRVITKNGLSPVYSQTYNVVAPTGPAAVPVVRQTANLSLSSGNVFVKLPGSDKFVPLTKDMLIPIGTVIDARDGKAHLTFANADGTLYDGIFWDGVFQVLQGKGDKPVATLKLRDDLVGAATASIASAVATPAGFKAWTSRKRGKKKNGLWGDAKGKYRSSGKGGSATVRGTRWYVANYTFGSLFKVQRGSVTIDPIRGKNFTLKAGKQYFIFYKRK